MFLPLFLLLTVVPLTELAILLRIGAWLGWMPTLGLVVVTGLLGAVLARREGLRTISRIQQELERGSMPTSAMADGVLILIAGVALITPGILTDACGFALLIPPVRGWVKKKLADVWRDRIVIHTSGFGEKSASGDKFIDVAAMSTPSGEDLRERDAGDDSMRSVRRIADRERRKK